jgi:manganese transport system permease protein
MIPELMTHLLTAEPSALSDSGALGTIFEPFQYPFMVRAMLATSVSALVSALLSCWLVLVGWSLMGDAVSHAVLPGVALAYIFGLPFAVGALVFGFLAVALIGAVRDTTKIKEDAAIGVVFTTLLAFGLVLVSVVPSHTDLMHIIFGNILGISVSELWQILIISAVVFIAILLKRRDLTLYAFDPGHAHALGLSTRMLGILLLAMLALTTVVGLQVVGVILVVAMLIIPGATAVLLTKRMSTMLIIAPVISVACSALGIYISYWLNSSPGGLVVVLQGVVFTAVYLKTQIQKLAKPKSRRALPHPVG